MTPGLHLLETLQGLRAGRGGPGLDDLLWFTSGRAVEDTVLAGLEPLLGGVPCERFALRLEPPGGGSPGPGRLARRLLPETLRARRALSLHRSERLLGLGGFTSLPAVLAARSLGLEVHLIEVNAVAGKATRWLSALARRVYHSSPSSLPPQAAAKHLLTGPPLSPRFAAGLDRRAARAELGLAPGAPLLLVLGGSQGAAGLNRFLAEHAGVLSARGIAVLHQVGPGRLAEAAAPSPDYRAVEYVRDVATALQAADFVLCRGGASTLAEVAEAAVPAWVVPYPHHTDQHQARNAADYGEGFVVIEERELDRGMALRLAELLGPEGQPRRRQMRRSLEGGKRHNAAELILSELGIL